MMPFLHTHTQSLHTVLYTFTLDFISLWQPGDRKEYTIHAAHHNVFFGLVGGQPLDDVTQPVFQGHEQASTLARINVDMHMTHHCMHHKGMTDSLGKLEG